MVSTRYLGAKCRNPGTISLYTALLDEQENQAKAFKQLSLTQKLIFKLASKPNEDIRPVELLFEYSCREYLDILRLYDKMFASYVESTKDFWMYFRAATVLFRLQFGERVADSLESMETMENIAVYQHSFFAYDWIHELKFNLKDLLQTIGFIFQINIQS
ncbi:hypothetical protein HDU97_001187 [Phlyctochytrium planicorne]|nr:hypothetical protein HDU97_001187 [Phlyctochytrium planicorne]